MLASLLMAFKTLMKLVVQPSNPPNLARSDDYLFPKIKAICEITDFRQMTNSLLRSSWQNQENNFLKILELVYERCDKCVTLERDCVQKVKC